jgi:thiamine-monophosphate kinase
MPTENELLRRLKSQKQTYPKGMRLAIGDDCAVFDVDSTQSIVATTDLLVENVHFRRSWSHPQLLGRKSLVVNLSDLAAMGARPFACLLNLMIPAELTDSLFDSFIEGFVTAARHWACPLIGGDLSNANLLQVGVTVLGVVPKGSEVKRSTGQPGDRVLVIGDLGLSRLGLELLESGKHSDLNQADRAETLSHFIPDPFELACIRAHLAPEPLLEAGSWLRKEGLVHAMMDVSDGLALDLERLAVASGLQAVITRTALEPYQSIAEREIDPDVVLNGGEDYALLFTASDEQVSRLQQIYPLTFPHFRIIGVLQQGPPGLYWGSDGTVQPCQARGFEHFR